MQVLHQDHVVEKNHLQLSDSGPPEQIEQHKEKIENIIKKENDSNIQYHRWLKRGIHTREEIDL